MFPTIQIGPAAFPTSGLILILGIWIGLTVTERYSNRFSIAPSHINSLVFLTISTGILGARLGYFIQYPQAFLANPVSIISRNVELLDPFFGMICALLANWIYLHKKNLPILLVLDALVPMAIILLIATSLADLASGSAYGKPSNLPWAIDLWGATRHPTQVYMLILSSGLLGFFWPGRHRWSSDPPGFYFLSFLASTAGVTIFLEAFRGDSQLIFGGLHRNQIIAWLILASSLFGIRKVQSTVHPSPDR